MLGKGQRESIFHGVKCIGTKVDEELVYWEHSVNIGIATWELVSLVVT